MKDFDVYFEIFGKKMKTTVAAFDKNSAETAVKNKITFHKIEESNIIFNKEDDDIFNGLMDMFGMK